MSDSHRSVAVVVIGRNEGERLRRCLESVVGDVAAVCYVDSGSTDGSVELAKALRVEVVILDDLAPFTAARGRNAGIAAVASGGTDVPFVQVVDGDCEVIDGWLDAAVATLTADDRVAAVCGRRRERHRDRTVYNRLCDLEWDTPVGAADACGGDALFRSEAIAQVGGYRDDMIAGEEPELCHRLRQAGWKIMRIDHDMTWHDAAMTRFGQWWKRSARSGHAYAEQWARHRASGREQRSIVVWGLLLPAVALGLAWATFGISLLLLLGYGLLWWRVRRHRIRHDDPPRDASLYATFCVIGKFPHLLGILQFTWNRIRRRQSTLIEYKGVESAAAAAPTASGTVIERRP